MQSGEKGPMADERDTKTRLTLARLFLWIGGGMLAILLLVGVLNIMAPHALETIFGAPPTPTPPITTARPRAAIIDQTGYSFPSPSFIAQAQSVLEQAGYAVTYYPPEDITVSFYRTLPDRGYRFIVFQTHATDQVVGQDEDDSDVGPGPFLFTTEHYAQQRHLTLQVSDQVRASELFFEGSPELFAVGPAFVRRSMRGLFPNTIVVIGGCQSLASPDLAQAFLDKGASVVIGWDEMVNLTHNNRAVLRLLEAILVDDLTPDQAVAHVNADVGPDPIYDSSLTLLR